MGEQGPPNLRQGKVEAGTDGAAALIPTLRGAGRDDPRRLEPGLLGWKVGKPFLDKPFTERPRQVQQGGERCRTVDLLVGRLGHCPQGAGRIEVEAVRGKDPEVAFGGDPAGDVAVGGHDRDSKMTVALTTA